MRLRAPPNPHLVPAVEHIHADQIGQPRIIPHPPLTSADLDSPVRADVPSGNGNHAIRTEGPVMDFVFWIIVIVLLVGVVWWLLNRSNSATKASSAPARPDGGLAGGSAAASAEAAGTAGLPTAAGFGRGAEPVPPTTANDEPASATETATPGESSAPSHHFADEPVDTPEPVAHPVTELNAGGAGADADRQAEDEWETQWSEASGPAPAPSHRPAADASADAAAASGAATAAAEPGAGAVSGTAQGSTHAADHVHHAEYTDPHAPTLPGAETAAADALAADDAAADDREMALGDSAPASEPAAPAAGYESAPGPIAPAAGVEPTVDPIGHLAADQPYGAGSSSPGPDGSGPADFVVKGDAGSMVYYEEGHPDYEQTPADVWFESAAHAEAAGFRAPRRTRL